MERKPAVLIRVMAWLLAAGFAAWMADPAEAMLGNDETCQHLLDDNLYRCRVHLEGFGENETCVQAISPGDSSGKFDLESDVSFRSAGCACQPKGRVDRPEYDRDEVRFQCADRGRGVALEGKVLAGGSRLVATGVSDTGLGSIMECHADPTCDIPPLEQPEFGSWSCTDPMVHPSTPAGDLLMTRSDDGRQVTGVTPIACSTMGIAEMREGFMQEVVASEELDRDRAGCHVLRAQQLAHQRFRLPVVEYDVFQLLRCRT